MMAVNFDEFPLELCSSLLTFVALTGLDVVHNAVHKSIWDLLSNNRLSDRVPIQFKVLEGDHEYPKPKPKRSTYEFYLPKGILKTNWMNKHLNLIPALVVVFFDLDWDDQAWNEKLLELCAKVQVVRAALSGRNTKVAVVLIQRNSPLPPGEDVFATERATALCSACELTPKMLYVFPHTDHLFGYAIRLENAFYELAQNYYQNQIKVVKSHREHLNKTTHQLLFVRHQFKIAFYSELKHDAPSAVKHYKQAYTNLMEVRTTDTNISEFKIVAGFINYKICKLSFYLNTPVDAISQFRKHIDILKHRTGHPELAFEHSAWMSKQFSGFGDLFEEAIKSGLSAIQTQHPGFYYQQAALHARARKETCRTLCQNTTAPSGNLLANLNNLEYYGQRPWRPGIQSIEPPDQALEKEGIKALQHREITEVNHAMLVVPLLSSAIAQFKRYRCPRMKRYLVVKMGEEYYDAKDYSKALALLNHVIWDYRLERWWSLLGSVLTTAIRCAYLIASIQDYVTLCLEAIGPRVPVDCLEKERIQKNVVAVMANKSPDPEPELDKDAITSAEKLWEVERATISGPSIFTVEISHFASFVNCKALFIEDSVTLDSPVSLNVFLRVACPLPFRIAKLCVTFTNQSYNEFCILSDTKAPTHYQNGYVADLLLEPGKTKVVPFTFIPSAKDVGQTVEVTSVLLQLGDDRTCCAILHWKDDQDLKLTTSLLSSKEDVLDVKCGYPSVRILPRESHLTIAIEHEAPALVNEYYPLKLTLTNHEPTPIQELVLSIINSDKSLNIVLLATSAIECTSSGPIKLHLESFGIGQQLEKLIFLKTSQEGSSVLRIKIEYKLQLDINGQSLDLTCVNEEELHVPVVNPFTFQTKMLSIKTETLDSLWVEEPFLLHAEIHSSSPWPLLLKSSWLKLNQLKLDQFASQVEDVVLENNDVACECHYFDPQVLDDGYLELGTYFLSWKRKSCGDNVPFVVMEAPLPSMVVIRVPISITLDVPSHGWVRTPLTISYQVRNRTQQVQEFDFCMDSSDSFMYAGHKQVHFKILPQDDLILRYNLYPLVSGYVPLPKLRMLTHDSVYDSQLEGITQKMIPSHIFIMPQAKQLPAP